MSRRAVTAAVLLTLASAGFGRCEEEERWRLSWADEFDGAAGQSPDPARWRFDVGTGLNGWGNAQLEYDTARPENASLDGEGHLAITARREPWLGREYTSARLTTKEVFAQRYGRFEARIKLPRGRGLWPAFWMLGANIDAVDWPECGEIDVMEYRGQEPRSVSGAVHGPGYSGGTSIHASRELPGGAAFDEDFHVFAVEWTPDWITWELDGKTWHAVVADGLPAGARWVFDQPFFVLVNLAVGGNFVGPPDPSIFPRTMLVDWVRVYERVP